MKKQQGFTLIELMIVVAIIAILAAIAISQYQDYVIRSQVSEGSALADGVKTSMAEFQQNKGYWPDANSSAGLAAPASITGSYLDNVDVSLNTGKVTVQFGKKANPKITQAGSDTLVFSAYDNGGSISWTCTTAAGTTIDAKYRAASCR